ncbi:MAG TPA: metallophosphoesterase family protein [Mucilaginibacter sp.]
MKKITLMFASLFVSGMSFCQTSGRPAIPASLSGLSYNADGKLILTKDGHDFVEADKVDMYKLSHMIGNPTGTETGIMLDLQMPGFNGTVAYGPYVETAEYPTVAFLPKDVKMTDGKALLEFKKVFAKANDFYRFQDKGKGIIGYRIMDAGGRIIYEGRAAFEGKGPYQVVPTIIEGPMVNILSPEGCVISYETQVQVKTKITIGDKTFGDDAEATHHEITVNGLQPGTNYEYNVSYGDRTDKHNFKTAARDGGRKPFTFAFASANRATTGGGENDFGGTNYQSTREIMALAMFNNAAFIQTTGDFTTGANVSEDGHLMEYANFKRALEPFWFKTPVYLGFGDHEPNTKSLKNPDVKKGYSIEVFPYATNSGEATFAKAFVNPDNGPQSEDGASYDPNPAVLDFPTYKENVFYYTYDNVAMIVLNTEYWESKDPNATSGNPEGYIMDQQVKWLKETMDKMEKNPNIDHIFVNIHGSAFPNGDHLDDAMWWQGDNTSRAVVAGVPVPKGTIERRDEILDCCVNKSKKFISFLSGDKHNFSFIQITPQSKIYKDDYTGQRIKISRPFYTINNGGGGSAPYGMLTSPWSSDYKYFTQPPVVAFISVNGKNVNLKAMSAETFGSICNDVVLR